MKSFKLHHAPAIATLSAVVAVFALSSAAQTASQISIILRRPVVVEGVPTPDQMMRIEEGSPVTIAADQLFIATGLGVRNYSNTSTISVSAHFNGGMVMEAHPIVNSNNSIPITGGGSSVVPIPPGLKAGPGTMISVDCDDGVGVLLGYLADA